VSPHGSLTFAERPDRRNRPQCDIAHQPDLGHIPSVVERFCNDREFAPAAKEIRIMGLKSELLHTLVAASV
jgi:hypothetical protein